MSRLPIRSTLAVSVIAFVLAGALTPLAPREVAAAGGSSFVSVANGYRHDARLGPVALHSVIDKIAVERGKQLARDGQLGHDFDYLKRRLDQENICWRGLGEIVAYNGSGDYARFGDQWYNSDPHRKIMLGDYTHAGGSREYAGGRYYGVMVFVKLCGAATPVYTVSGFTDIGGSPFVGDIAWLVDQNITGGCDTDRFCPRSGVARAQMASFLKRALGLPGASRDYFRDDGRSIHEDDINRAAEASLTGGCFEDRYCPGRGVTRAQMATFLVRALDLPPTSRDYFSDDGSSMHEDSINRLAAVGIAAGCASSSFCPERTVSREQMAAFLHRALD